MKRRKKSDDDLKEKIEDINSILDDLKEDTTLPKNIKTKLDHIQKVLSEEKDPILKINTALNELDDITNDSNIQSYTRTQLWNISSLLESALV
jgi:hypothetical protein